MSRFNKATAAGLATGGRMARNVPSANVIGVRPAMSFTSSRAPWSVRIRMIDGHPRLAAP